MTAPEQVAAALEQAAGFERLVAPVAVQVPVGGELLVLVAVVPLLAAAQVVVVQALAAQSVAAVLAVVAVG